MAAGKGTGKKQNTGSYKGRQKAAPAGKGGASDNGIRDEISLIVILAAAVLLFLCNFGVIGPVGDMISRILFGIFGLLAYVAPVLVFLAIAFRLANKGESIATIKLWAGGVLVWLIGIVLDMLGGASLELASYSAGELYSRSSDGRCGGGVLFGTVSYLLNHFLDKTGTILIILVLAIICIVIISE